MRTRDKYKKLEKQKQKRANAPPTRMYTTRAGPIRPREFIVGSHATDPIGRGICLLVQDGIRPKYTYQKGLGNDGVTPTYRCTLSIAIPHLRPATTPATTQGPLGATVYTWTSPSAFNSKAEAKAAVYTILLDSGELKTLMDAHRKGVNSVNSKMATKCKQFDLRCWEEGLDVVFTTTADGDSGKLNGRLEILIGGHSLHTAFSSQSCVSTYRSKWNIIDPILTLGTWDTILQLKANYLANEAAQTTAVPETPVEEGANQEGGEL